MMPRTAAVFVEGWKLRDARPVVLAWTVAWNDGTKTETMPWQSDRFMKPLKSGMLATMKGMEPSDPLNEPMLS